MLGIQQADGTGRIQQGRKKPGTVGLVQQGIVPGERACVPWVGEGGAPGVAGGGKHQFRGVAGVDGLEDLRAGIRQVRQAVGKGAETRPEPIAQIRPGPKRG